MGSGGRFQMQTVTPSVKMCSKTLGCAATTAERVTVCLAAGIYTLTAPLQLGPAHAGMIIESCGGPATLEVDPAANAEAFIEGLVTVAGVAGVSLAGLTLNPPPAPATATFNRLHLDFLLAR